MIDLTLILHSFFYNGNVGNNFLLGDISNIVPIVDDRFIPNDPIGSLCRLFKKFRVANVLKSKLSRDYSLSKLKTLSLRKFTSTCISIKFIC